MPCDDGTVIPPNPQDRSCYTIEGSAGALGYVDCGHYVEAGLEDVTCSDAGAEGAPALAAFCERSYEVGTNGLSFLNQRLANCVEGMGVATGSFFEGVELNVEAICDPELPSALRACADSLNVCERTPLCVEGGEFGCEDIVAECPALTPAQCRSGFDSRAHAGRVRMHQCLTAATGDCVDSFYRCAWGL